MTQTAMNSDQAYQDGYDARVAGEPLSVNPFNPTQTLFTDWTTGWLDRRDYEPFANSETVSPSDYHRLGPQRRSRIPRKEKEQTK